MTAPQAFVTSLERAFQGRLRIRFSDYDQAWHIEQKVGRAMQPTTRFDPQRDDLIRARDGYHFVLSIRLGDRMPCPDCGYALKVPAFDTMDVACPYCRMHGRQTRIVAGFWPLGDALLEHLRKIDPLRGAQHELSEAADRANRALLKSAEDEALAPGFAAMDDNYRNLVGIPHVGYTGKELT